ncbi:MAG: hypothetical protein PHC40_04540 [Eubacteriales bacterium]|nr:hypothetical protein [Eubacteriales bacterium]
MADNKWKAFSEKYEAVIVSISEDPRNRVGAWKPNLDSSRDMLVASTKKATNRIRKDDFVCYGIPDDFDYEACIVDIDAVTKKE